MIKPPFWTRADYQTRKGDLPRLRLLRRLCTFAFLLAWGMSAPFVAPVQAAEEAAFTKEPDAFRVLSWNVSQENFFRYAAEFRAFFTLCVPDILLLDEIPPGRGPAEVTSILSAEKSEAAAWNAVIGVAGGHQRGAIASKYPLEAVAELDGLKYPAHAVARLKPMVPESIWNERVKSSLDAGIPVMGAIVQIKNRAVLAVTVDLQCCGNPTNNWPEFRRQIEAQETRSAIHRVLARRKVDAIVLAGDLNLVFSATPLAILTNPYPEPHFALAPVNAVHLDGTEVWTWDGRDSPFPSRPLDFSFFTPASLKPIRSLVLSTEDFSRELLTPRGFESGTSRKLSDHLPILVDYRWQEPLRQ
jgi:hypothetical protein